MSDELITIAEFIKDFGLTMESVRVPANPHMEPDSDRKWRNDATHFHCTIRKPNTNDDEYFTCYYSVGIGVVKAWAESYKSSISIRAKMKDAGPWRWDRRTRYQDEVLDEVRGKYKPDLESVLDCLASDAAGIDCEPRFEDWAESLGYDSDSRKAERTYNTCRSQAEKLCRFLGREAYETLLYNVERL